MLNNYLFEIIAVIVLILILCFINNSKSVFFEVLGKTVKLILSIVIVVIIILVIKDIFNKSVINLPGPEPGPTPIDVVDSSDNTASNKDEIDISIRKNEVTLTKHMIGNIRTSEKHQDEELIRKMIVESIDEDSIVVLEDDYADYNTYILVESILKECGSNYTKKED